MSLGSFHCVFDVTTVRNSLKDGIRKKKLLNSPLFNIFFFVLKATYSGYRYYFLTCCALLCAAKYPAHDTHTHSHVYNSYIFHGAHTHQWIKTNINPIRIWYNFFVLLWYLNDSFKREIKFNSWHFTVVVVVFPISSYSNDFNGITLHCCCCCARRTFYLRFYVECLKIEKPAQADVCCKHVKRNETDVCFTYFISILCIDVAHYTSNIKFMWIYLRVSCVFL